ncbi:serine-rich adhesin for platelets [Microplitis demolitor]|uniref:serine-rich adhesin for platelets n=1 Tax=Microplitis demolitor TaxID=69319 RepID=UPI0004CCC628|nr:serine-rich adhesin for platelets [Microplitis demolitor]
MMVVRLVLTTTLFLLVIGNSTSQLRDELVATTKDPQSVDKDEIQDHRQSRTASHTESPTFKAKREQIFRNRLAARRRQALTRSNISSKSHLNSTLRSKPAANVSKNSVDMLQVQETRHSVYVTAPSDDQPSVIIDDSDDDDDAGEGSDVESHSMSKLSTEDRASESKDQNHGTITSSARNSSVKNSSLSSLRIQKNDDQSLSQSQSQSRRKNTVVMPESLYNHFRPVERNIPIEDMTQFRYFGQKIRPENTTSNNSVEVTSVSPSSSQNRRRFFVKGLSTTATPSSVPGLSPGTAIPKLEEIINEEMNIAVEKSTVERNKIPKTKNVFRSTSLYLRKSPSATSQVSGSPQIRASDPTIMSNIIGTNRSIHESSAHATEQLVVTASVKEEKEKKEEKKKDQLRVNSAYQINVSTQIPEEPHQRNLLRVGNEFESEITDSNDVTTTSSLHTRDYQSDESNNNNNNNINKNDKNNDSPIIKFEKQPKNFIRNKKSGISRMDRRADELDYTTSSTTTTATATKTLFFGDKTADEQKRSPGKTRGTPGDTAVPSESSSAPQVPAEPARISTWLSINSDPVTPSIDRNNRLATSTTESPISDPVTVQSLHQYQQQQQQHSSLRIVVTEPAVSGIESAGERNYQSTVKTGNSSHSESSEANALAARDLTERLIASGDIITTTLETLTLTTSATGTDTGTLEPATGMPVNEEQVVEAPVALAQQMQHPYAYTITNITRLLGNYSGHGPGSNDKASSSSSTPTTSTTSTTTTKSTTLTLKEQVNSSFSSPSTHTAALGALESTRTPGPVSVGPTAVEYSATSPRSTSSSSSSSPLTSGTSNTSPLVGERGRKGTTLQQRVATVHRNTSYENTVEATTLRAITTTGTDTATDTDTDTDTNIDINTEESSSLLRWNYTSTTGETLAGRQKEVINDRRYLRKSASAVLNQRISADESIRDFKRRRSDTRSSTSSSSSSSSRIKGRVDERVAGSRSIDAKDELIDLAHDNNNNRSTVNINNTDTMGKSGVNSSLSAEMVNEASKVIDDPKPQDAATSSDKLNFSTDPPSASNVVNDSNSNNSNVSTSDRVIETGDKSNDYKMTSTKPTTETVTSRPLTSTSSTVTTIKTPMATRASPVFPVTPMLFNGTNKVAKEEDGEKIESNTESPRIPDRPFGIAKDLDPSEIQKMYRSQTTLKPEPGMTTLPPEVLRSNTVTSQPKMDTTSKKLSSERSPEVRARNLSDKTKDKDDVLPIMHLYNTSNIFNGTMKDLEDVQTDLPVAKPTAEATTLSPNPEINAKNLNATRSESKERDQVPDSKDVKIGSVLKGNKSRQEVNREAGSQNSTAKWPNTSSSPSLSSSASNRTRHRPNYYSGPPESNGFHPELNSTFYEPGIIPVTPRDPINISEVITKRHDGDTLATQETVVIVSYILASLVFFPIVVGVVLIFRRLIIKNRKVLEESDTSSEISCRKDALNLENGDFKTSIEKAITKLPRIQHLCHEAEKPAPPAKQESRWEFPRDKLRLQTVLGQGNFGQVWKAEADDLTGHKGTTRLVAVKTVKEGASAREKEDLVRELEIMQQLGNHPNVVTLLGCCTEEEPHYLILEYVMYGKLLAYLRDHRTRQDFYNFSEDSAALTSRDLTVFGYCVARGMEYLASKKIIHRDLAARNVLVDHNKLCKIADFGMSRFANEDGECIETRHGRNALPIRWMAPESLIYSLFTTKTDVWSFGILMWEIVTLGSTPYPDMAAREVMRNVQDGYRLERPSHCRSELFRVIARCWHADPDRRPEFQLLRRDLAQLLEDNMNGHYVDLESYASECTD